MRKITIVCMLILITGCAAIQPGKNPTQNQAGLFHDSIEQLLQKNNPKPMQSFIKTYPESMFTNDAKQLLDIHSRAKKCGGKLKSCNNQLTKLNLDLKKLQEDIDRLTQLNLEMDRSSP